jgi:hypothetical protein
MEGFSMCSTHRTNAVQNQCSSQMPLSDLFSLRVKAPVFRLEW